MPQGKASYVSHGFKTATQKAPKLRKDLLAMTDAEKRKRRAKLSKKVSIGLSKAITEPKSGARKARPKAASRQQRIQAGLDKELTKLKTLRANTRIPKSVKMDAVADANKRIGILRRGLAGVKKLKKGK